MARRMQLVCAALLCSGLPLACPDPIYPASGTQAVSSYKTSSYQSNVGKRCTTSTTVTVTEKVVDLGQLDYRRAFIVNMTKEAFQGYRRHSWGQHNLLPLSLEKQEAWLAYSGQTLVGAMSTLFLMGLKEEFEHARKWIEKEMIIDENSLSKIGPLLSTYALTGDALFKGKAREIAELFTPTDLDSKFSSLVHRQVVHNEWIQQRLAYPYLSNITSEGKFLERVRSMDAYFLSEQSGLRPVDEVDKTNWMVKVKAYIQSKGRDVQDLEQFFDYVESLERKGLLRKTKSGLWYVRELLPMNYMSSLDCHLGATLALSELDRLNTRIGDAWESVRELKRTVKHLEMAKQITELCHIATKWTDTGLPPLKFFVDEESTGENSQEVFCWKDKCQSESRSYELHPHLAESFFVLYRLTKDPKYQEYAWNQALAIHKHARTKNGYASVHDVLQLPTTKMNSQPPTFLSSTLKYLWLTFAPHDVLPLDRWVFSAGQPIPVCEAYPACDA